MKKSRGVSRTTAKSKLEPFVTTKVNGWKPLTFVTKSTILDFGVFPDTSLKGTILIIRVSSKHIVKVTELKNFTLINVLSREPETFISVFRTNSLNLCLYLLSLVSYEKCMFQTMKSIYLLFIFSLFFCYFVFEVLIQRGIPNTLGK